MECKQDSFFYRLSFLHYQHVKCIHVMISKTHSYDSSFNNVIIVVSIPQVAALSLQCCHLSELHKRICICKLLIKY